MTIAALSVSLMVGHLPSISPAKNQKYFERLLHAREQFETVLKEPKKYIGYTHVNSEMLGGAHADALYPVGSASERYVLYFGEMGSGGTLIYQRRRGKYAFVSWHLEFVPVGKGSHLVRGTVPQYLRRLGFALSRKQTVPAAIRKQLSFYGSFASYGFHPEMGGYAKVIKANGSQTKEYRTSGPFSITSEEKSLLAGRLR